MYSLLLEVGLGAHVVDLDVVGEPLEARLPDLKLVVVGYVRTVLHNTLRRHRRRNRRAIWPPFGAIAERNGGFLLSTTMYLGTM